MHRCVLVVLRQRIRMSELSFMGLSVFFSVKVSRAVVSSIPHGNGVFVCEGVKGVCESV